MSDLSEQVDVCIIGGGIMGLFCALELSNAGKVVRIVDKLFTGSSRHNIGAVLFQASGEEQLPFLKMTHEAWEKAKDDYDIDMGLEKRGSAFLAYTEDMAERLKFEVEHDKKHGFENVSYEDNLEKLCKFLDVSSLPEGVIGAKISTDDSIVDTGKALDALRQLLIRNGVRFWGSDEVSDFTVDGNKILSVKTKTGEECFANDFLVTAGVWANKLLKLIDVTVPMRPARCHLLHISPNGKKIPQQLIAKQFPTGDIIIKYQRSGQVLVSYTGAMDQAQATWSNEVDNEAVEWVMEQLPTMLTGLVAPTLNKVTTVTLAITQDGYPFIGNVGKYANLTVALGFSGKSYAYSAGAGRAVKAIVSGEDFIPDLAPFEVDRKIEVSVTSLGNNDDEVVTIVGDKPDADPEVTMEVGDKPDADPEVTMEVGDKPDADPDITMEVGDKPDADDDITMEVDGGSALGQEEDSSTKMTVDGGSALSEKEENESSFVTEGEEGSALGKDDPESKAKLTVEGGSALGDKQEENESSFVTEGEEGSALGKGGPESKTKLTVEGGSALGDKQKENESSFVTDGEEGSALGKDDPESKTKLTVEGGSALSDKDSKPENKVEMLVEGEEKTALGAKKEPKEAKGKLQVDESSSLGLGAKNKPKEPAPEESDDKTKEDVEEATEGVDLKESDEGKNEGEAEEEKKEEKLSRKKSKIVYDEPVKKKRQQKIVYD